MPVFLNYTWGWQALSTGCFSDYTGIARCWEGNAGVKITQMVQNFETFLNHLSADQQNT